MINQNQLEEVCSHVAKIAYRIISDLLKNARRDENLPYNANDNKNARASAILETNLPWTESLSSIDRRKKTAFFAHRSVGFLCEADYSIPNSFF